jgi:hypothetical protein
MGTFLLNKKVQPPTSSPQPFALSLLTRSKAKPLRRVGEQMRESEICGKGERGDRQQTFRVMPEGRKEKGKETCARHLAGKSGPTMVQIKAKGKLVQNAIG